VLTLCHDGVANASRAWTFADYNTLTYPVLADEGQGILFQGVARAGNLVVIGPDMIVRQMGDLAINDRVIEGWIEDWQPEPSSE
jgi:hypothetical protein